MNQEPMVAIPLGQKLRDIEAPITPQAQGLMDMITQHKDRNPVYVPFKAGTATLPRKQFDESTRQWDLGFEEGIRQYDQSFGEDKRRFDLQFAAQEQQRKIANSLARASGRSGGGGSSGGSSGGGLPGTVGERKSYYMGQVVEDIRNRVAEGTKGRPSDDRISAVLHAVEKDMIQNRGVYSQVGISPSEVYGIFASQVIDSLGQSGAVKYSKWKSTNNISTDLGTVMNTMEGSGNIISSTAPKEESKNWLQKLFGR